MSRDLPTGLHTELTAPVVMPVILVEVDWPTGFVRTWNGYHTLNWDGVDWTGVGHLGSISGIKESSGQQANGATVSISGVPSAQVALALDDSAQGRRVRIAFGVLNATGFTIDPYIFEWVIDFATIVDNGETATITLNLEKELYDDRSDARRWNHEDQQIDYPGDLGFKQVAEIANKSFTWGKATIAPVQQTITDGNDGSNDFS